MKELESNSVSLSYGDKVQSSYVFFRPSDVIKILATLYLGAKAHGKRDDAQITIPRKSYNFYLESAYSIQEVKFEEFILLLKEVGILNTSVEDSLVFPQVEELKNIMSFINTQRKEVEVKQLKISEKCQQFLTHIIERLRSMGVKDVDAKVNLSEILDYFKSHKMQIEIEDLTEAREANFVTDVMVGEENNLYCTVHYENLKKFFLPIQVSNAIKKANEEKALNYKKSLRSKGL